jgi:hypothetical protein
MGLLNRIRGAPPQSRHSATSPPVPARSVVTVRVVEDTGMFEGHDGLKLWSSGYTPIIDDHDGGHHFASVGEHATSNPGVLYSRVAGVTYHPEALRDRRFAPGSAVVLRPEPDNPHGDGHAVGVWDGTGSIQLGYIPHDLSAEVAARIRAGEQLAGFVVREFRQSSKSGPRKGIHILVIPIGELRLDIAD